MRKMTRSFGLIDKETGEIYDADITIRQKRIGGKWVKVYQDMLEELSRRNLCKESYRVILVLLSLANYRNQVPGTKAIALRLGKRQPNVSRTYRELLTSAFLIKKDGDYYLNPFLCWKGSQRQLEEAILQLFPVEKPLQIAKKGV